MHAVIPSLLDVILEIEDTRSPIWEKYTRWMLCVLHVRNLHLGIPVSAKPSLPMEFADLRHRRVAQECFTNPVIVFYQPLQDRQNTRCLSVDRFLNNEPTTPTDLLGASDLGSLSETVIQGLRHLLFMCMGAKDCFLRQISREGGLSAHVGLRKDAGRAS